MLSGALLALAVALPVAASPGEPVAVPQEARAVDTSHPDRWVGQVQVYPFIDRKALRDSISLEEQLSQNLSLKRAA